jgi:hypothetical protein
MSQSTVERFHAARGLWHQIVTIKKQQRVEMFKIVKLRILVTLAVCLLTTLLTEVDGAPSAVLVGTHQHSPIKQTGDRSVPPAVEVSDCFNFEM